MRYFKSKFTIGIVLIVVSGLLILAGCSSAPAATTAPAPVAPSSGGTTINLIAQNFAFDQKTITVPAGARVTINFNNKDSGVPHNFALYNDSTAAAPAIFQGQTVNGPATAIYTFAAPSKPGTYFFRCDTHPTQMTGSFVVQ